ncbi:hypothetical protein [Thermincola potens]|uniref:DUF1440 domain-containing protein n=1 Tax=Thermincola potens (strain JR) TaxID=635013 RepID=D5XEL7_THEPJ|nr:hypothetical protein [Thermincola potens]ADG82088.1 hypothetical protein TherJR_1224 [Thermincola potens JR]
MEDRLIAGGVAGLAGSLVMVGLDYLVNLIPGVSTNLLLAASAILSTDVELGTVTGNVTGFIIHLICGSILGVIFIFLLEITKYRFVLLKGFLFGIGAWFIVCGMIARLLNLPIQDKFIDNLFMLLIHIPFGLTTAFVIKNYVKYSVRETE